MPPTNVQMARLYDQFGGLIFRDLKRRSESEASASELLPRVFARARLRWDEWPGTGSRLLWLADLAVEECGSKFLSPGTEFDSEEWSLERAVAGDLSKSEHRRLRDRMDADPQLAERLRSLRRNDADFEQRFPWSVLEEQVRSLTESWATNEAAGRARHRLGEKRYWRAMFVGAICAVVASLAVVLLEVDDGPSVFRSHSPSDGGDPVSLWPRNSSAAPSSVLQAYVFTKGRPLLLEPGASVEAGTRLQFRVKSEQMYLTMFGVDSERVVTTYVPARGPTSVPWTPGPAQPLGTALELSAVRGDEVFCALLSSAPLQVEEARAEIHKRVEGKEDFTSVLFALAEDPDGLADEVGVVHLQKP